MTLKFDFRDFERVARNLGALERQVPFALANAMSSAAFTVREQLITETWPGHVEVRNRNALRNALRVKKARKADLNVAIEGTGPAADRLNLKAHADGGVHRPKSHRLAIPPAGTVKRGARGVAKRQRPRAIIDATPKRALRITKRGIFVGQGGRLHLKYSFKPSANIKPDVPFRQDFSRMMQNAVRRQFPIAIKKAMATAFRK